jgi:hypothetical protein
MGYSLAIAQDVMASDDVIYIPSFIKIVSGIQKFLGVSVHI